MLESMVASVFGSLKIPGILTLKMVLTISASNIPFDSSFYTASKDDTSSYEEPYSLEKIPMFFSQFNKDISRSLISAEE